MRPQKVTMAINRFRNKKEKVIFIPQIGWIQCNKINKIIMLNETHKTFINDDCYPPRIRIDVDDNQSFIINCTDESDRNIKACLIAKKVFNNVVTI